MVIATPKIMRDPDTGASKGFGFVSFDGFEASDGAIEAMNGQYLCNRSAHGLAAMVLHQSLFWPPVYSCVTSTAVIARHSCGCSSLVAVPERFEPTNALILALLTSIACFVPIISASSNLTGPTQHSIRHTQSR